MPERILPPMYDSRAAAESARVQLEAIGVARDSISIRGTDQGATTASTTTRDEDPGLWGSIMDALFPDDDRYTYEEGVRRGSFLLSARVPEGLEDRAHDVLDSTDAVNVDERAESWRQGGWAGYQTGGTGSQAGGTGSTTSAYGTGTGNVPGLAETSTANYAAGSTGASGTGKSHDFGAGSGHSGVGDRVSDAVSDAAEATGLKREDYDEERRGKTGYETGTAGMTGTAATGTAGMSATGLDAAGTSTSRELREGEEAIPVVEEQVRVGKREVGRGSVRVRSYVVERPVEEQVNLREERVSIERRPVDRELPPGTSPFTERTIEATERGEEAVVSKQARVVEEVGIRKDVDTRTETVRDSVRKTEVEVEDDRTGRGGLATERDERVLATDNPLKR